MEEKVNGNQKLTLEESFICDWRRSLACGDGSVGVCNFLRLRRCSRTLHWRQLATTTTTTSLLSTWATRTNDRKEPNRSAQSTDISQWPL